MSTHDNDGREWAKVTEVVENSTIAVDSAFPCLQADQEYVVKLDAGGLYVECEHGKHYIGDEQLNEAETHYIGVYHVAPRGL